VPIDRKQVNDVLNVFEERESEVRSYCRSWPVLFDRASGSNLYDVDGNRYLDFFAGAGALNYGHNDPTMMSALLDYVGRGGVMHSLDMYTVAKQEFLSTFRDLILEPRGLDHRVMFTGPTGTNAVEAALKVARRATGRSDIVSFTNAFHGMTLGALALTGDATKRGGAGVPLPSSPVLPYCGYLPEGSTIDFLERMLLDASSGLDLPAAVIVETVQGEGGINVASVGWLRALADVCRAHGILLIVDDIQMGCGRTGQFFSFEAAGIVPDIVTLSKSLSGIGLPFAVTLLRPELDQWEPGQHNGTFRGNNAAFVTATAALHKYWCDDRLTRRVAEHDRTLRSEMEAVATRHASVTEVRGRGLAWGIEFDDGEVAARAAGAAFERGLLVETAGPDGCTVKLLPPLTTTRHDLETGLAILDDAIAAVGDAKRGLEVHA
jgi:diaminobutyrate-2-oxoglutarate transaminase